MIASSLSILALAGSLISSVGAQFPPEAEDVTIVRSKFDDRVTISFKEPGICETTPGVKSYAGYVHMPPGTLDSSLGQVQDFPINTFFWYFEARNDPENAPTSIWMNGGPGASSMPGLLFENGPCFINNDSSTTRLAQWSWNNRVNMLYIDQPVQAGFSYDTLRNVTRNLLGSTQTLPPGAPVPEQNTTFHVGTYSSGNSSATSLGSRNGAVALWYFSQFFFKEFPGYQTTNDRISIATQSYGGRYGPAMASFFQEQNEKIENGTWTGALKHPLNLDTLLLVNGCIDRREQWPHYPTMAFNNTYGIETVNETIYRGMVEAYATPGGCRDQIDECQALSKELDPDNVGVDATVNRLCQQAETYCTNNIRDPYLRFAIPSRRDYYDISQIDPTMFPDPFVPGYLNQASVQQALGVPLNFSGSSAAIASAYRGMGDYNKPGWLDDMGYLLDKGMKISLMYGDRDFACPWYSGEAASLAIPWSGQDKFAAAGYEAVSSCSEEEGALVRQHKGLSFVRVLQAGHAAPAYQPEITYRQFNRAVFDRDIATGKIDTVEVEEDYSSEGPDDTLHVRQDPPPQYPYYCYILDPSSCTDEQINALRAGTAIIENYIMIDPPYRYDAPMLQRREFIDPYLRV